MNGLTNVVLNTPKFRAATAPFSYIMAGFRISVAQNKLMIREYAFLDLPYKKIKCRVDGRVGVHHKKFFFTLNLTPLLFHVCYFLTFTFG